jgi:hypothetical protein
MTSRAKYTTTQSGGRLTGLSSQGLSGRCADTPTRCLSWLTDPAFAGSVSPYRQYVVTPATPLRRHALSQLGLCHLRFLDKYCNRSP